VATAEETAMMEMMEMMAEYRQAPAGLQYLGRKDATASCALKQSRFLPDLRAVFLVAAWWRRRGS